MQYVGFRYLLVGNVIYNGDFIPVIDCQTWSLWSWLEVMLQAPFAAARSLLIEHGFGDVLIAAHGHLDRTKFKTYISTEYHYCTSWYYPLITIWSCSYCCSVTHALYIPVLYVLKGAQGPITFPRYYQLRNKDDNQVSGFAMHLPLTSPEGDQNEYTDASTRIFCKYVTFRFTLCFLICGIWLLSFFQSGHSSRQNHTPGEDGEWLASIAVKESLPHADFLSIFWWSRWW